MIEEPDGINVKGAREHNLQSVHVFIPRNKITVITGLSGSGKSSLAFDTVYAEGQRRYVESLSAYARSFLEQLKKPEVDSIVGLSPAISIEQKNTSTNPRSTVGTVTEVYDYLRLLFARAGTPFCPNCSLPVKSQKPEQVIQEVLKLPAGTRFQLMAPMANNKKGEFHAQFEQWMRQGFVRAKVDGAFVDLAKVGKLKKTLEHSIDLIIDRLVMKGDIEKRLRESVHLALRMSGGTLKIGLDGDEERLYSLKDTCLKCQFSFPELEPRLFSFNNPRGSCPECHGLGVLTSEESDSDASAFSDDEDMDESEAPEGPAIICPSCNGTRLKREALSVFLGERNISQVATLPSGELLSFVKSLTFDQKTSLIVDRIVGQIYSRLGFLDQVGVGYIGMDRPVKTLSGGESQRVRLATQIGSSLVGILYVLDEPSVGLHPKDHHRLLNTLKDLRDLGNTILLVEHDEDTIRVADHIIDMGPRAGILGGHVVAAGSLTDILHHPTSLTGQYLSGKKSFLYHSRHRRAAKAERLVLTGARGNNLKNLTVEIPLGTLTAITGVSGGGKSTLVIDTLYRVLAKHFYKSPGEPAAYDSIKGLEHLDRVIEINQKPIGRTPRSNPATYVGLFSLIRSLYSQHPESKIRGYKPGRFSFNVKGGRCESCLGGGATRVEMHFLADVLVPCDVCQGRRYNRETLSIKYKGKSISDVLDMSIAEALPFFENHIVIHKKLETLHRVGLDYISLGQSSTTLSGGEAQRVKLSKELSKRATGRTLYILDEPTTGLHFDDVHKLVELLNELVEQGNTVVIIEHNLDVIKSCDHVIDLGPEGGTRGGFVLATGTPEEIAKNPASVTGVFLKQM